MFEWAENEEQIILPVLPNLQNFQFEYGVEICKI